MDPTVRLPFPDPLGYNPPIKIPGVAIALLTVKLATHVTTFCRAAYCVNRSLFVCLKSGRASFQFSGKNILVLRLFMCLYGGKNCRKHTNKVQNLSRH